VLHFSNSGYVLAFSVVFEADAGAGVMLAVLRYDILAFTPEITLTFRSHLDGIILTGYDASVVSSEKLSASTHR